MELLIGLIEKLGFSRREPKFKSGDHVQRVEGGELMVIRNVSFCKKSNTVLFSCKWFDPETRENKFATFSESQIRLFNWYAANYAARHGQVSVA